MSTDHKNWGEGRSTIGGGDEESPILTVASRVDVFFFFEPLVYVVKG